MIPGKDKDKTIYQFKITLKDIEPPIWRRIQVPSSYSFWDLHVAIQDAMGWADTHLHEFLVRDARNGRTLQIGIPDEGLDSESNTLPGWKKKITGFFKKESSSAEYIYDFGDDWIHTVIFEKCLPREEGRRYPRCVDGERACPPEDCGGTQGYQDFLDAIMDPKHDRHDELLEWIGGDFAPEEFDCAEVRFENPAKRLKMLTEQF